MRTNIHRTLHEGMTVYGSDGEKIGDIASVQPGYFIIEKGWLFPEDVYVPESAVATVDEDEKVHLTLSKDEAEVQDWSAPPMMDADYGAESGVTDRDVLERREERLTVDKDVEQVGSVRVGKHVVEDEQSVDVPVSREDVTITRRAVDRDTGETLDEAEVEVPVYAESVKAGKDTRVVEELEIGKKATTDTERVTETVRREEFDVDEDISRR
jgi:uncharacterized protein (TIGR02271 family)